MKKKMIVIIGIVLLSCLCLASKTANVLVTWDANTEADLAGYYVYMNNTAIADVKVPAHSWVGTVTMQEGDNTFQVAAYDLSANLSAKSDVTPLSTIKIDTVSPAKPTGCAASIQP